ncbi:MAG: GntR family transcriptional regulator [Bacteroidota bacterium]|uniref:GntR family transcriptional regulator n=1 Tax=Parabacteroides sp. FAFU027 TaxID=2922715 RepID=UPI001FAF9319|nr:GntR family transcriptional regulator [Parabacteroides sp. FAFU027]MDP4269380.1 GntR family transcriptional regulator [Bacteroidota bacterium]
MSIDFKSAKGIFQQIADNLCHQILEGKLAPGERVPSVRDLAVEFEVNRNTLLRTYAMLEDNGIIVNKRGIGFFVADNAIELIRTSEKQEFYTNDLPMLIQKIRLLKLTADDLNDLLLAINENKKQ